MYKYITYYIKLKDKYKGDVFMELHEFMEKFPIQLNIQQKEAVRAVEGPTLLLAVPGSGKTTVLVTRLGYMIHCCNIDPSQILTVTYTVAATKDMRSRFSSFFGEKLANKIEFRTINGICSKIISYYERKIGQKAFDLVTDDRVINQILIQIYQEVEKEYPTESDIKGIRTAITYIKNMMLNDGEIKKLEIANDYAIFDIYKAYCGKMRENGFMDYDDQMVYAFKMLELDEGTKEHFQQMYPYICVDEAQDTSKIQHKIIAALASKTKNIFMVGDEDQSIYGFRAAYPKALLSFEKNYPGAKVLLMEENFRSNANIVTAADHFIQMNTMRHKKHIRPTREATSVISSIPVKSQQEQYKYLLDVAKTTDKQTAILYRNSESAIPVIDLFERKGISYRMRNAELTFFGNRVVTDIINIFKFALNPMDEELFMKIYYKLSIYLKKSQAYYCCQTAKSTGVSILSAAKKNRMLKPAVVAKIAAIQQHFVKMKGETPTKALKRVLYDMNYMNYLTKAGLDENKVTILKNLTIPEKTIKSFLDRLDTLRDLIKYKKFDPDARMIFSTVHSSKGLEYDSVYMIDVKDGVFPETVVSSSEKDKEKISIYEEERRMFYVGVTRAKNNLYLFRLPERSVFCRDFFGEKEIITHKAGTYKQEYQAAITGYTKKPVISTKLTESYQDYISSIGDGVMVKHNKYGTGVIDSITADKIKVVFQNEKYGTKVFAITPLLQRVLLVQQS